MKEETILLFLEFGAKRVKAVSDFIKSRNRINIENALNDWKDDSFKGIEHNELGSYYDSKY